MADPVAIILADGFEETEAVATIDVLRRAEVDISVAALDNAQSVRGAHGMRLFADCGLERLDASRLEMVILPGGMPGSKNLAESDAVLSLLKSVHSQGGIIAAICAAPLALHAAGLLEGVTATAYPAVRAELKDCNYTGKPVEKDGSIVTGKGPGVVFAFALTLVDILCGKEKANKLADAMLVPPSCR